MTVVEFADFECPFCARFSKEVLGPFLEANPRDVAIVYRHFPLPYHKNALGAARAAECAADQGRFAPFHDLLYENQKLLASVSFDSLAGIAGVADLDTFAACVQVTSPLPSIAADTAAAKSIGLRGTPTIVINGMQFAMPPTRFQLDSILEEVKRLRSPS